MTLDACVTLGNERETVLGHPGIWDAAIGLSH